MNRFIQIAAEHIGRPDKGLSDVTGIDPIQDQTDRLPAVSCIFGFEMGAGQDSKIRKPVQIMRPVGCSGVVIPVDIRGQLMYLIVEPESVYQGIFCLLPIYIAQGEVVLCRCRAAAGVYRSPYLLIGHPVPRLPQQGREPYRGPAALLLEERRRHPKDLDHQMISVWR